MRRCLIALAAACVLLTGCNLSSVPPTPTPERSVPTIEFLFPTQGTVVVEGTDVQIQLLAQDTNGIGIARVELYVDDVLHQQAAPVVSAAVNVFTVNMNWMAESIGRHALSAVAYRPDETASDSALIALEVIPASNSTPNGS